MYMVGNQCQVGLGTNYVYKIYKNPVKKWLLKNTTTNTIQTITQNNGNNNKKKKKQFVFIIKKLI